MPNDQKKIIEAILNDIVRAFIQERTIDNSASISPPPVHIEQPKLDTHGDFSSNIALQLAKQLHTTPRSLADEVATQLKNHPQGIHFIQKVEVAGPGFINIWIHAAKQQTIIHKILKAGIFFGQGKAMNGSHLMLEYVSANPTGPLHVGHARQAVLGDTLAKILATQGAKVWREFYYNDSGNQIKNLTASVIARINNHKPGDVNWPEDGYAGEYIQEIANAYKDYLAREKQSSITKIFDVDFEESVRSFAVAYLRAEQNSDLASINVEFDGYFLESSLYKDNKVHETINRLNASGYTYEQNNALWLRSTAFGDDKDRVMVKSDGTCTYFVPDVAYHVEKWKRGFQYVINIQGTDHHSTVTRVRAGLQALNIGIPKNYPEYILHSMVRVIKNGEEVKISKRAGNYVTIRDLVSWSSSHNENSTCEPKKMTGKDAIRFFLISRKPDTEFIFDVDLARQQNDENPVYYVQYAHARISSILENWGGNTKILEEVDLSPLNESMLAKKLIKLLADFPQVLERIAHELTPHHIAFYVRNLAAALHSFYNAEHVLVENLKEKLAKLALLAATQQVLRNSLELIGVSTPNKM